jgi:hypothetical protein
LANLSALGLPILEIAFNFPAMAKEIADDQVDVYQVE